MDIKYKATSQRSTGGTDIEISIGVLSMRFDLAPQGRVRKSEDTKLKMVCTEDHVDGQPQLLTQQYICQLDPKHPPLTQATAKRAKQVDEVVDGTTVTKLVVVDATKVAEAKAGEAETGVLDLKVHPAADVAAACRPGEKGYRLRPSKTKGKVTDKSIEMYGILRDLLLAQPDVALVGELMLRGTRSLYRVEIWHDQLMLAELIHPEDLAERDLIQVESDASNVAKMSQLVATFAEPWDPALHRHDVKAALDAVVAEAEGAEPAERASVTAITNTDISSLLDQALAYRRTA